jgi:hypothetical protein
MLTYADLSSVLVATPERAHYYFNQVADVC